MIGVILVKNTGPTPRVAAKEHRRATKASFEALGVHWHRSMRPKHFTKAGAREYGYKPRQGAPGSGRAFRGSYLQRKLRAFGHTRPLEFTGESRQLTRIRDVRTTSKGVRVVMRANKFNLRRHATSPDMRQELRTVSQREQDELVRLFDTELQRGYDEISTREVKRL